MSLRPDNWSEIVDKMSDEFLRKSKLGEYQTGVAHINAGADAIYPFAYGTGKKDGERELLEALKAKGVQVTNPRAYNIYDEKGQKAYLNVPSRGWIVFIADEEAETAKQCSEGEH